MEWIVVDAPPEYIFSFKCIMHGQIQGGGGGQGA